MTDAQKAADTFFRSKIPNLSGATLSGGEQDGKTFRFQYINQNIPVTLSQMSADRVDETNNKFKLLEALQSVTGPVQGGRMTQVSKTYGIESFDKALENLGWKWLLTCPMSIRLSIDPFSIKMGSLILKFIQKISSI